MRFTYAVTDANYQTSRLVFDRWYDSQKNVLFGREPAWQRLTAALWTESQCRILAHGGLWTGGDRTNTAQRLVLAKSWDMYVNETGKKPDGYGNNGGSVGALQQIPTAVALLRTVGGLDNGAPFPWGGWGSIVDCMKLETSIPKFLDELRASGVSNVRTYQGVPIAREVDGAEVLADLLRVQRPNKAEVDANYGVAVLPVVLEIATMYKPSGSIVVTEPKNTGWTIPGSLLDWN